MSCCSTAIEQLGVVDTAFLKHLNLFSIRMHMTFQIGEVAHGKFVMQNHFESCLALIHSQSTLSDFRHLMSIFKAELGGYMSHPLTGQRV